MRVSLHTEKAIKVLDYIKDLELRNGGIRAWKGGPAYPEVTGYCIPTLLDYGEIELAVRCANYLVKIQNDDGSFYDMHNVKRSFDTAACMEGLNNFLMFTITDDDKYYWAAQKAGEWLNGLVRDDGAVRTHDKTMDTHLYTMRVSWLLNSEAGAQYWMDTPWEPTREHYVAYALEGLWNLGHEGFVRGKLSERDWNSEDLCANAQFAVLFHHAAIDGNTWDVALAELVEMFLGEIFNSWTAKWILDMWKVIGE